ncbi:hypothetical protein G6L16_008735 [Agrobacterium tumefaciens]|uniref:hypothetical protein n=1 Tax=Agrobacterium tumefaciens TaxID=358 RepID=UPI0015746067|nr:hypothetical protein [Agrobacterium tumefaciens]NSZ63423.1 hypothetical protein [Agrobacterium tumefaciens]NTA69793.1 hypothetical protein [Agrobacterium tumefaciens]WIE36939.1 hypothetical protein G6L16_008735 [Agrobacterium tumefaciens]
MFKLTPDAKARVDACRNYQEAKQTHFANLSDENLVASAKLYMANMSPMNFAPGEPVYDATMWHVILPELMRRVGGV